MLTHDDVRSAGGMVHSDGNIFFTNIDKLNAATAPLLQRIAELEQANKAFAQRQEWWNERMSEMETELRAEQDRRRAEINARLSAAPAAQHPDDEAVDKFAAAMKSKLALAREKGRGGWETCPPEELSRMLREHVEKGDPRDVANFCMFLWSLGYGIAAASSAQPMTASEIWASDEIMEVNADAQISFEHIQRFVKAVERHHHIKEHP